MKKNILLLAGTIVFLLILTEAGARIWAVFRPPQEYGDKIAYSYFPYLPYSPTADYQDTIKNRSHNSRGFRNSYEIKVPKPPDVFRIVCLGGSTTYDAYGKQPNELIWTGRLEHYLNRNPDKTRYEVINAGADNYTTYMNLIDYLTRCRDLQIDMIIIFEGINDIYFNGYDSVSFAHSNVFQPFDFNYQNYFYKLNHSPLFRYSMFLKLVYIKFFISNLNLNVSSLKYIHYFEPKSLENARSDSMLTFKKGLAGFIAISKADNCKLVLLSQAYNYKSLKKYFHFDENDIERSDKRYEMLVEETKRTRLIMQNIAQTNGIPFMDMNDVMNQQDSLFSGPTDALHFSKEGSDHFAFELFSFLKVQKLIKH